MTLSRDCGVIIVAAGKGERMGGKMPKQFRLLVGEPVFSWSLQFFLSHDAVTEIALVVPPDLVEKTEHTLRQKASHCLPVMVVAGGTRRQDSVGNGLSALSAKSSLVAVHDAARPFPPLNFSEVCAEARSYGAAIFGLPVTETIKQVDDSGIVVASPDRSRLWVAQTPQVFQRELLASALALCNERGIEVTDDAAAVALLGRPVKMVEGSRWNIKLTVPDDWLLAECIGSQLRRDRPAFLPSRSKSEGVPEQ
ncbi:MAG: 2-C-methyl-D-erythritol 4-phosphate cytidylyltransferase [Candidatus Sumerlaeaceae bacterium]|nr:2-C-methyl-D-erythritol 4-phosphate cytidylyltransferase [Candidatus Sumerlaeaceae bacterium]